MRCLSPFSWPDLISKIELESFIKEGVGIQDVREMWYPSPGIPLQRGLKQIEKDKDVVDFCSKVGKDGVLDVYVIHGSDVSPRSLLAQGSTESQAGKALKSQARPKTVGPSNPCQSIILYEPPIFTPSSSITPHTSIPEIGRAHV